MRLREDWLMQGLAQVNLIVTDLERAKEFWAVLGFPWTPRHPKAAVITVSATRDLMKLIIVRLVMDMAVSRPSV